MITPEDFVKRWGAELVSAPPAFVEGAHIPESDKEFLTLAGLPRQAPIPAAGDFASLPVELPSPEQETDPKHRLLERYGDLPYLRLGYIKCQPYNPFYDSMPFCIAEGSGHVGIMSHGQTFGYINSSIPQFAAALLEFRACHEFFQQNEAARPRTLRRRLREMERVLSASDPEAFSDDEYAWPVWIYEADVSLS